MHSSGRMYGLLSVTLVPSQRVISSLYVPIALGLTGHTSSQTTQGVCIDQGRQRPWLKKAVPRRMGPASACSPSPSFWASEIFWMAPVGQTSLHRVQLSWQKPVLKSITGVHSPSSPPSLKAEGCRTLVGQTLMHWSHLIQRSRNSASATVPGGRMALWLKLRLLTAFEKRRNG